MLAIQAAKSSDPKVWDKVMRRQRSGERSGRRLAKGLELLAAGRDIDYVGATSVELVGPGSSGVYREVDFKGGKLNGRLPLSGDNWKVSSAGPF